MSRFATLPTSRLRRFVEPRRSSGDFTASEGGKGSRHGCAAAAAAAALLAVAAGGNAVAQNAHPSVAARAVECHHYSITARVRPFVLFWISRSGVGDALVTRQRGSDTRYSLLIGSDPDRAPRRINRWGYIQEEIRDGEAKLIGLMTQSDEESPEEAAAAIRRQAAGSHPFYVIQSTVSASEATSVVKTIAAPEDYTVRHVRAVLDLVERDTTDGRRRELRLPAGTRPGFLSALADAMHSGGARFNYVHHGRLYELHRTRAQRLDDARIAGVSYGPAIAGDFLVTSAYDGEQTRFSMTYGTDGRLAEVPLVVTYQPRWWMQLQLTIDDQPQIDRIVAGAAR